MNKVNTKAYKLLALRDCFHLSSYVAKRLVNVTDPEKRGLWSKLDAKKRTGLGWSPLSTFPKVCSSAGKPQAAAHRICGEDRLKRCVNGSMAAAGLPVARRLRGSGLRPCKLGNDAKLTSGYQESSVKKSKYKNSCT